jgi:hypothetical protein
VDDEPACRLLALFALLFFISFGGVLMFLFLALMGG